MIAGYKAQRTGKNIEGWVDASLQVYRHQGRLFWQVNYPEISQRGYQARVIGKAGPDRTVALAPSGRCVQVEVKTWQAANTHLYDWTGNKSKARRREQYHTLLEWAGAGAIAFYLVCWRNDSFGRDWRVHHVEGLAVEDGGLRFDREAGLSVEETAEGWPDWLEAIE